MVENITSTALAIISLYRTDYLCQLHVREMAKLLGRGHTSLLPHLRLLETNGILRSHVEGRNHIYLLNRSSTLVKEYLALAEKMITLALLEHQPLLRKLVDEARAFDGSLLLFGSYAKGTQTKKSDIDLLAIGILHDRQRKALKELAAIYGKSLHLVTLTLEEFERGVKEGNPFIEEIISNHLILANHDLFLTHLWRRYCEE